MYYLRTRLYDPQKCRFLNVDDVDTLGSEGDINGYHLFFYGKNDPINRVDKAGSWSLPNWAKVAIGGALIIGAAVVATVATGGVACFAIGAAMGAAEGAITGAIGGAVAGVVSSVIETGSWDGALEAAVDGAADGFMYGAISGFIIGGFTSTACFVAGTLIQTENGLQPIEQIEPGQLVWAENPDTGERALKRVVRTFLNEKDELVHVKVKDEIITCTTEHPFYVHGKGWVAAKDLQQCDKLELLNGEIALVDGISHEKTTEVINVYNFEVEEFHTYFVGACCILVNNVCAKARREGVRKAWQQEKAAVQNGTSKYPWTSAQKSELLRTGRVRGFQGHHIKSVKAYPELAADPNNIYFCTPKDHLWQHYGNWRNATDALRIK